MPKMKITIVVAAIMTILSTISCSESNNGFGNIDYGAEYVSIFNIINSPEDYNGRIVAINGIISIDQTSAVIFYSELDFLYHLSQNGINIELQNNLLSQIQNLNGKMVMVYGTIDSENNGMYEMYPVSIANIQSITQISPIERYN